MGWKYATPEEAHDVRKAKWREKNKVRALRLAEERAREKSQRAETYVNHPWRFARPSLAQIAARDASLDAVRTLTAVIFGDPAPGRSALDRRNASARVTAHADAKAAPLS